MTGGGSGIGREVAIRLAVRGACVAVVDRNAEAAEEVAHHIQASGGTALSAIADVRDPIQVERAVAESEEAFHGLDILVNSAGACIGRSLASMGDEEWSHDVEVILGGTFRCCRAVLPGMIERGFGIIVNIASVNAYAGFGSDAYSAAKAGVVNLTRNLAVRHGPEGVRVNTVAPATVRTPAWADTLADQPDLYERLARWYPLGRVGEVADVAAVVVFLASADAAWITGITVPVDGGLLAGSLALARDLEGES